VSGLSLLLRGVLPMLLALAASFGAARAQAQAPELDAGLNEAVVTIPRKGGLFTFEIETTFYKPDGDGPFPVVVINHGKALGDPRFQARYRPAQAARYFLQRGYAVLVPMRQGFSKSTGSYNGVQCNIESNGRVQAEDVKATLDWAVAQPWADKDRLLVVGQSHGGWTTLAFGTFDYPGVKGLVNFAGGLRQESCIGWNLALSGAVASYARTTRVPSLWFYGENDSFFPPETARPMFDSYVAAGGRARLVAFGRFGSDAHGMFGARTGNAIWQPELTKFLAEIGLPHQPDAAQARFGGSPPMVAPPRTDFAALDDVAKLPHVKDTGRAGYTAFLARQQPRAFAIARNGAWGWAEGGDDPLARALSFCNRRGNGDCRLYAVDDHVVWKDEP
jgi:dienelactone hydrolase